MRRKSFSVVKQILRIESRSKRNFCVILAVMICIISFLFIYDLMMISAEGLAQLSLLGSINEQQKSPFMQMEFIGIGVILLGFILIWSFEDFNLKLIFYKFSEIKSKVLMCCYASWLGLAVYLYLFQHFEYLPFEYFLYSHIKRA